MSDYALKVEGLTLDFPRGPRRIVEDLSFTVPEGRTLAIVGSSGSGKTLASLAVMGLLPQGIEVTRGEILLDGVNVLELTDEERRRMRNTRIAMVLQNPMSAFDPIFTIWSHFKETMTSHRDFGSRRAGADRSEMRAQAVASLGRVGFEDPQRILELYPFQMSGGMLQRVMLALALLDSPPLVIADEATTDLDVVSQAHVLRLLKEHCRENRLSLLLITHDLSVAAGLADEMVVMDSGRQTESGTVREIFAHAESDCARRLLAVHRALYSERYVRITANLAGRETPREAVR
ncbi:MAG: ABC transporter ATP-binding protein [Deltaproteobacteria bacterium]|jgi:ABC-type glutathione transport system ATPase component|nr:ABC transporter ATP-binding protein [Deltaproteobacteria bacterium]